LVEDLEESQSEQKESHDDHEEPKIEFLPYLGEGLWCSVILVNSVHLNDVSHVEERGDSVGDLEDDIEAI